LFVEKKIFKNFKKKKNRSTYVLKLTSGFRLGLAIGALVSGDGISGKT
jgi:hypothetical protein